ncbi:MAG: maleylpyruvate isomerase N-terminal domain-containing protein, partial [Actinomycetota bacterium]|nr:maleylpyruvate isomerase N-terminal domain-containing protein [Actinomycetota bacterium]
MNPLELLDQTQSRAATVIAGIGAEHLGLPSPCGSWTVRDELNKLITSTMHMVIAVNEDRNDDYHDLGAPPDLAGEDATAAFDRAAKACREAFSTDGVFERTLHAPVPGVQLPADQLLGVRIFDTTV